MRAGAHLLAVLRRSPLLSLLLSCAILSHGAIATPIPAGPAPVPALPADGPPHHVQPPQSHPHHPSYADKHPESAAASDLKHQRPILEQLLHTIYPTDDDYRSYFYRPEADIEGEMAMEELQGSGSGSGPQVIVALPRPGAVADAGGSLQDDNEEEEEQRREQEGRISGGVASVPLSLEAAQSQEDDAAAQSSDPSSPADAGAHTRPKPHLDGALFRNNVKLKNRPRIRRSEQLKQAEST